MMMIEHLRRVSRDTLTYGFGGVLEQIASLFLLPFFTRVFAPVDYGILETIGTFASVATLILLLGLNSATQRYYYDEENQDARARIVSTAFWTSTIIAWFFAILVVLFRVPIADALFQKPLGTLIGLAAVTIPFTLNYQFVIDTIRLKLQPIKFVIVTTTQFLARIVFAFLLVIVFRKGLEGNFIAVLTGTILAMSIGLVFVRDSVRFTFQSSLLPVLLRYGIPLAFASLAYWVLNLADRIFLLKFSTLEQIGLYSMANRFTSPMFLILSAFQLAWAPFIFSLIKNPQIKMVFNQTIRLVTLGLSVVAVGLTLFDRVALSVIAPQSYAPALAAVPYLTFGLIFLGTSTIVSAAISIVKRVKYITYAFFVAAGINIIFNFILIPPYGMIGAAISTSASYASLAIVQLVFAQRLYNIPYDFRQLLRVIFLTAITLSVNALLPSLDLGIDTLMRFIVFVLFLAVSFSFLHPSERRIGIDWVKRNATRMFIRRRG